MWEHHVHWVSTCVFLSPTFSNMLETYILHFDCDWIDLHYSSNDFKCNVVYKDHFWGLHDLAPTWLKPHQWEGQYNLHEWQFHSVPDNRSSLLLKCCTSFLIYNINIQITMLCYKRYTCSFFHECVSKCLWHRYHWKEKMYRNRLAYHIYLQKFETRLSCLLNCKLWLAWEPKPLLHYQVPEKTDIQFLCKWLFEPKAIWRDFCFLDPCKFLTQPIRKPIDHRVVVIFDILLHLFWLHVDKQNILLPVCALLSPHIHMITGMGEGEACVRGDIPQSLFNNTFPPGLGSVCLGVCLWRCEKSSTVCVCVGLCVNKCVPMNERMDQSIVPSSLPSQPNRIQLTQLGCALSQPCPPLPHTHTQYTPILHNLTTRAAG